MVRISGGSRKSTVLLALELGRQTSYRQFFSSFLPSGTRYYMMLKLEARFH
jgi:hypothetical protein